MSWVTQQFGVGSRLKLGACASTRLDVVPVLHDCVQAPTTLGARSVSSFHLTERTREAQRGSVACPETHSYPNRNIGLLIPTIPLCPNRSCQARTLMISSTPSWVLENQCPAPRAGLLRPVTVASQKICPPTPRTPLHTVGWLPPRPAAIAQSLARGPAPPTILALPAPPGTLGQWPKGLRLPLL